MLKDRFYYGVKPFLPWRLRMALRRLIARRKQRTCQGVWPINEAASRPPEGWPGWPGGKQFAFVLSHDVEGRAGLAKCRQLMQFEMERGFRSSFNFVPEGDYHVPAELRAELVQNGFEVGVHDLHHDGKLYWSRHEFSEKAARINQYLKDWGAVGFRSGFMLRNLDWAHDLNVLYDASTFDTDPFEPQPDGMGTIFPFWVPLPPAATAPVPPGPAACAGYVELPYTLPQDATLFLLLREKTTDLWLRKLDWVARHGGMVLMDVHPDYLRFDGDPPSPRTFPAAFYAEILQAVRQRCADAFWHPLPRELAAFAAQHKPRLRPRPKRVGMVCYSFYATDARVIRYAEALAERGDEVDVVALRRLPASKRQEQIAGVNLHNIQPRFGKNEQSRLSYLTPLIRFLFASAWWIARQHARRPYDVLHIHNVPDFLVFAALYPKLTGAKVILDIHDIVPEFFVSKFGTRDAAFSIRILKAMERASALVADRVIIANHLWLDKYAQRTGAAGKCTVFINNVNTRIRPDLRRRNDGRLVVLFPGGLQWHQGLDVAIRAFDHLRAELPGAELHIYGDGNRKSSLVALSRELGLDGRIRFFDPVPLRDIAAVMADADVGVVPKRADSFGNEAYSTKIMEFMALGVPVVVSRTKVDQFYFDDSVVRFFESGNPKALAEAVLDVAGHPELRRGLVARAGDYANRHSWESRKGDYLDLVDSLCAANRKAN